MTSAPPRSAALSVPKAEQQLFHLNRLKKQEKIQSFSSSPFLFLGTPPTQLKDLQGHGEAGLLGAHQRPVAGAEILTWRQQQQHGDLVSKLQQLTGVHAILVRLRKTEDMQTHCTYVEKVDFTSWLLLGNG